MSRYNEITNRTSPNKWVGGNTIKGITIHHWGDPRNNPTAEGVVNWLCNPASQVSAHFVITGTGRRVWQLVDDKDRAWHAMAGNHSTLGLELDPRCRDEDYDVAAEVIADLWRHYGKLPLYPHSFWVPTACPGNYDLGRLQRLAEAKLNPPKPTPAPKPVNKPVPASVPIPGGHKKFTAKLDKTEVWDLTTNPNYKSVKTLKKGEEFIAYATIKFNNSVYYITEYSHSRGIQNGINSVDLEPVVVQPTPKPTPAPTPAPKPVETPTPAPEPTVVQPTPEEIKQQEENTRRFREEMERLSKENNSILKAILDIVTELLNKFKGIFK